MFEYVSASMGAPTMVGSFITISREKLPYGSLKTSVSLSFV